MHPRIEDYKIWYPYEVFYIESMFTLTRSATAEVSVFREVVRRIIANEDSNRDMLLDAVQNLVTYAGALSRYFWPTDKTPLHQLRGERLREAFSIDDSSTLKDRKLRNFIEHFDEKLDTYLMKGMFGNIVPSHVGFKSQVSEVDHFFRVYFLDEAVFRVLDLEYKIDPIIHEVIRIHNLLFDFRETGRLSLR